MYFILYAAQYRLRSRLRRNVLRQNGAAPKRPAPKRLRQDGHTKRAALNCHIPLIGNSCSGSRTIPRGQYPPDSIPLEIFLDNLSNFHFS